MPFDAPYSAVAVSTTHLSSPPIAPSGVELDHILANPQSRCDLETLAAAISIQDLIFECEGDGQLAHHPAFPAAVRQVIGSELMTTASREALAGMPCPWGPACGLHVFFNGQKKGQANSFAPPWVLRSETTGANSIRITLRLYGQGQLWSSELSEATHRALERGINLAGIEPACQSVLIRSVERVWTGLQDPAADCNAALIALATPFHPGSGIDHQTVGKGFLFSLLERAEAVARWHGLDLELDHPALAATIDRCDVNETALELTEWNRAISQTGMARIPMEGQTGLLQLQFGPTPDTSLVRLLQIGSLLHSGDDLAFGLGRYDLFLTGNQASA